MGYTFRDYLTSPSLPNKQIFQSIFLRICYTAATVEGINLVNTAVYNFPYYYNLATNKVIKYAPNWIIEVFGFVTVGFFTHMNSNFGTKTKLGHTAISMSHTAITYGAYKFGTSLGEYSLKVTHIDKTVQDYFGEYGKYVNSITQEAIGIVTATTVPVNFIVNKLATPVTKLEEFARTIYITAINFICGKEKVDEEVNTEHFQSVSNISPNELTGVLDDNTDEFVE